MKPPATLKTTLTPKSRLPGAPTSPSARKKNAGEDASAPSEIRPKLRFPEFRGGPGWEACPLEELADFVGDRVSVFELNRADYVSTENLLPDFGGLSPCTSFPAGGSVVRYLTNDILAANIRPYLKKIWMADRSGGASNDVIVVRAQGSVDHQYLSHALKNDRFVAYVMSGAKGLKMPRGDVSLIRAYLVPTPSPTEQRKIASCLSSLDDLIGAERRKLDTLKTHKKGLMQQIFPGTPTSPSAGKKNAGGDAGAPSETQPRFRFPEFLDAPEWTQSTLGKESSIFKGKGISKADIDPGGPQPCIRYGELYTHYGEIINAVISRTSIPAADLFLSNADDVIIPSSGETKLDIAKASCVPWENVALGGDLNVIRSSLSGHFLSYYLNGPKRYEIARVAQGDTVAHLYPSQLEDLEIAFPSPAEQHRIAACLSSLDDLIGAQTQKIEALKTHKKGLMQQLFPAPEEVGG